MWITSQDEHCILADPVSDMKLAAAVKAVAIGALALVLFVPVSMIQGLIAERQARRNEAVAGITEGWGGRPAAPLRGVGCSALSSIEPTFRVLPMSHRMRWVAWQTMLL